jgi:hypothetical protein
MTNLDAILKLKKSLDEANQAYLQSKGDGVMLDVLRQIKERISKQFMNEMDTNIVAICKELKALRDLHSAVLKAEHNQPWYVFEVLKKLDDETKRGVNE